MRFSDSFVRHACNVLRHRLGVEVSPDMMQEALVEQAEEMAGSADRMTPEDVRMIIESNRNDDMMVAMWEDAKREVDGESC